MNRVAIATIFNLADAELMRSRLEAAGFHPFIANELSAGWLGGTSAAGQMRIEVPDTEAAGAKEFLATPVE